MPLSDYALIDEGEEKRWLDVTDTGKDELIRVLIEDCSDIIESWLDRQIVTRGALTEYHTFEDSEAELFTLDYPIISVTSVHEDTNRTYGATALLTVTTQYIVSKPVGKIIRVYSASSGRTAWLTGFRAVKVIYTAGYADTDSVPRELKDVCKRLVALKFREVERGQQGLSGQADDVGNYTRFGPPELTKGMQAQLRPFKRNEYSWTGERDS